jgi:hypothetical protein
VREPHIELLQGSRVDGIDPPGALGSDGGEPVVPQHLQVLGDGRVRDAELVADGPRQLSRRQLTLGQEDEQPSANWVTEDVECVHASMFHL